MDIKNTVVYIIGFVGVGKYTIAKELERIAGFRVVDNHTFNNVIFPLFRVDGATKIPAEAWEKVRAVRNIFFEGFSSFRNPEFNFVFTNALSEKDENDKALYQKICKNIEGAGATFIPVRLTVDKEENRRRITSKDRELRMKQTTDADVNFTHDNHEVLMPQHKNTLDMDVTKMDAREVAEKILAHIKKIKND